MLEQALSNENRTNMYVVPGEHEGFHMPGNINIFNRPQVYNPEEGGNSTVWSMGIGIDNGKTALIPRISDEGKILSPKEAIDLFKKTKRHLGIFNDEEASNRYAEALHRQQEQYYKTR